MVESEIRNHFKLRQRYRMLAPLPVTVDLFEPGEPAGQYEILLSELGQLRQIQLRRRGQRSRWIIGTLDPGAAGPTDGFDIELGTIGHRVMQRLVAEARAAVV